jgi:hypothetical protein
MKTGESIVIKEEHHTRIYFTSTMFWDIIPRLVYILKIVLFLSQNRTFRRLDIKDFPAPGLLMKMGIHDSVGNRTRAAASIQLLYTHSLFLLPYLGSNDSLLLCYRLNYITEIVLMVATMTHLVHTLSVGIMNDLYNQQGL